MASVGFCPVGASLLACSAAPPLGDVKEMIVLIPVAIASKPLLLVQLLDGFETTADHVTGLLPELFRAVGFEEVRETTCFTTMFGTLALFRSAKVR